MCQTSGLCIFPFRRRNQKREELSRSLGPSPQVLQVSQCFSLSLTRRQWNIFKHTVDSISCVSIQNHYERDWKYWTNDISHWHSATSTCFTKHGNTNKMCKELPFKSIMGDPDCSFQEPCEEYFDRIRREKSLYHRIKITHLCLINIDFCVWGFLWAYCFLYIQHMPEHS